MPPASSIWYAGAFNNTGNEMYLHGNWFCKPKSLTEAREIFQRALESGAEKDETFSDWSWNAYGAWGVRNGLTHTQTTGFYREENSIEYTIEELRKKFPLLNEQEWKDQLKIGQRVEVNIGKFTSNRRKDGETGRVLSLSVNSKGRTMATIEIDGADGECDVLVTDCLRPIRSERDKWINNAAVLARKDATISPLDATVAAREIYDALKSGKLKAPEVDDD